MRHSTIPIAGARSPGSWIGAREKCIKMLRSSRSCGYLRVAQGGDVERSPRGGVGMPMVEDSITINAPAADLFTLSLDYALRRAWDPFVRAMRFGDGAGAAGKGVHVWVRAWNGLTM